MSDRQNRTLICSVLFVDIVEYSLKPVSEQLKLKGHLTARLNDVLKDVALNDRVVLDTGDGAAISFLGDPEDALFVALSLRDGAAKNEEARDEPQMRLRMGINLGPVRLIKDLNGQRNIIGDGINVAQRVISYATPGQVLASRSYFEVVSRIADEIGRLFQYEGARIDKHVREHEIYEVVGGGDELKRSENESTSSERSTYTRATVIGHLTRASVAVKDRLSARAALGAALLASVVLVAGIAVPLHPTRPSFLSAIRPKTEALQASATARQASAKLNFAIAPWGEVVIDGVKRGASPPLLQVALTPGAHKVEIQNGRYPPLIAAIDAKPGSEILIKHAFR